MQKIKEGDEVRILGYSSFVKNGPIEKGTVGIVVNVLNNFSIAWVDFPKHGQVAVKLNHLRYVNNKKKSPKKKPNIKVSDIYTKIVI